VWYGFFTAVLPSWLGNPILRNQAELPLNFQLWLGHPPSDFSSRHIMALYVANEFKIAPMTIIASVVLLIEPHV
jgi:hypothetical protein